MSRVRIVGAAIERDGMVLAAQRSHPPALAGRWEFAGGKVELGESLAAALMRECQEELGVSVVVGDALAEVELPTGAMLTVFWASLADPAQEPQRLEHAELRWCGPAELPKLDWLATNIRIADEACRTLRMRLSQRLQDE